MIFRAVKLLPFAGAAFQKTCPSAMALIKDDLNMKLNPLLFPLKSNLIKLKNVQIIKQIMGFK